MLHLRAGLPWLLLGAGLLGAEFVSAVPAYAATLTLPPDAGAPPDASTTVPLLIDDATGLLGADLVVGYDPAVARATGVSKTPLSAGHSLTFNLSTPGVIRISLFGAVPLSGGGELLSLAFVSVGPLDSRTALDLVSATLNEGSIPAVLEDGAYCVHGLTGEVGDLALRPAAPGSAEAILSWRADPFATGYNVYVAERPDLADLSCFLAGVTGPGVSDGGRTPPLDGALFYLVTAVNCRGESTLGFASSRDERTNPSACP